MGLVIGMNSRGSGGGGSTPPVIETAYSDLKTLRDNGGLTPGTQYRITDFVTTTAQDDTQSAGHQFDIIVVADSANTLNENARACLHSGDTYFSGAGANLEAWEIKYCIDNDTTRFAWADTTNGKGVIYYMKDEWNNECPYDFKNIQFKRYKITDCEDAPSLVGQYSTTHVSGIIVDENSSYWCYTFSMINLFEDVIDDVSVYQTKYAEASWQSYTRDNIFKESITVGWNDGRSAFRLRDNVMVTDTTIAEISPDYSSSGFMGYYTNIFEKDSMYNTFGNGCGCNTFGYYFYTNTGGTGFYSNTFENECSSNVFGNECLGNYFGVQFYHNHFADTCQHNSFKAGCEENVFGDHVSWNSFGLGCSNCTFDTDCSGNTLENSCKVTLGVSCNNNYFGNSCYDIVFGEYCSYNHLGNGCYGNTFGQGCINNFFGNDCEYNTFGELLTNNFFGNTCTNNTFGNECYGNTFGNECRNNTLGNYNNYNTFGDDCCYIVFGNNSAAKDYYRFITIDNGNGYIRLYCSATTTSSNYYQNVKIAQGVNNNYGTYKDITDSNANQDYQTVYQPTNSQTISV